MFKYIISLHFLFSILLYGQEQKDELQEIITGTLGGFISEMEKGNLDEAKKFFISETVSASDLKSFEKVVRKVGSYLDRNVISPVAEGEKLISIPLRQSVVYLLKIEDKWLFTDGTLSNIPKLLEMAELLNDPYKTLAYFRSQFKAGDLDEALNCFVPEKGFKMEKEKFKHLYEVINFLIKNDVPGKYQGKGENKSLVSFPVANRSISLVKQSGDWLMTINTRNKINVIYQDYKTTHVKSIFPESLNETFILMKNWQWIGVLLILVIGVIVQWVLQSLFMKTVKKFTAGKDLQVKKPRFASVSILCIAISCYLLVPALSLSIETEDSLTKAAILVAMISGMFVLSRGTDMVKSILLEKAQGTDNKVDDVLIPMLHKIIKLAVFIIGLVLIASNIGVNVAGLVAGLGIAGMAFALAAKDTVENIFGSITVLTDKPFEVGDFVSINGIDGIVEQIGLRSTRIRTFYKSQVNVPNSTLIKAIVDNYGRRNCRRIKTAVSLTYDTPPEKIEAFCEGVRELIRNHPSTLKDSYHVNFNEFSAASLDVLVLCYIDTNDYAIELRERQRLFMDIMRLAVKLEIEFAFPTQTIHMATSEDLHDPVKNTSLNEITAAYEAGRQEGKQIISETGNNKDTKFPEFINYIEGPPYVKSGK